MITGSAALPLPSFFPFYFHVRAFLNTRGPDYLGAWDKLFDSFFSVLNSPNLSETFLQLSLTWLLISSP